MNLHRPIAPEPVEMSPDGEVLIPEAVRRVAGLIPGMPVVVGINDRGEAVVMSRVRAKRLGETAEARGRRIRQALDDLSGRYSTHQPTDEVMAELRGDRDA